LAPLIFLSAAWALDEPTEKAEPPAKSKTPAEQLAALRQDVQKARGEILTKYRKAEKEEEKQELLQKYFATPRTFAEKFLELARSEPKDPAAIQALVFLVTEADGAPESLTAADIIVRKHLGDQQVLAAVPQFGRAPSAAQEKVLRAAMKQARDTDAKATLALAQNLKEQVGFARQLKDGSPDELKQAEARLGEEGVKRLREADADKMEDEAAALYERVAKEYADVRSGRETLGAQAKSELFELRHLSVGKPAPEIEAEDLDGTKFKLSDYRGKVVLLDFWGHW
jgi:hypothetical protein